MSAIVRQLLFFFFFVDSGLFVTLYLIYPPAKEKQNSPPASQVCGESKGESPGQRNHLHESPSVSAGERGLAASCPKHAQHKILSLLKSTGKARERQPSGGKRESATSQVQLSRSPTNTTHQPTLCTVLAPTGSKGRHLSCNCYDCQNLYKTSCFGVNLNFHLFLTSETNDC